MTRDSNDTPYLMDDIRVTIVPKLFKTECKHVLKGLLLQRASYSDKIALAGSRRLRSTLVAAPALSTHAVVTLSQIG
jgi:hypothetical protein